MAEYNGEDYIPNKIYVNLMSCGETKMIVESMMLDQAQEYKLVDSNIFNSLRIGTTFEVHSRLGPCKVGRSSCVSFLDRKCITIPFLRLDDDGILSNDDSLRNDDSGVRFATERSGEHFERSHSSVDRMIYTSGSRVVSTYFGMSLLLENGSTVRVREANQHSLENMFIMLQDYFHEMAEHNMQLVESKYYVMFDCCVLKFTNI